MYLRQSLALEAAGAGAAAPAAGRARPARDRGEAAHRAAHRADPPPADGARGRAQPPGAQPARRAGRAAHLGQARRGAHQVAPGRQRRPRRWSGWPTWWTRSTAASRWAGASSRTCGPRRLSNLGLAATLEILAREFAERSGVEVHCAAAAGEARANAELVIYRVVQEAITNISKYAAARQVWITLAAHGRAGRGVGARRRRRLRHRAHSAVRPTAWWACAFGSRPKAAR